MFSCSQKVYAVVIIQQIDAGPHQLQVRWNDPTGKLREKTPVGFYASQPNERIWAWLKLYRPTGASLGALFNPAIGMSEFIGEWTVKFYIDKKQIGTRHFKVLC